MPLLSPLLAPRRDARGGSAPLPWTPVLLLALAWAVLPALPALAAGAILGSPWTDLYPSVWGLGWFAAAQPGLPAFAPELAAPEGMGFYYASPLHGWAATPLVPVIGAAAAYNLTLLAARVGTVLAAYGAAGAAGLGPAGALVAAAVYGTAPFFHGYAVEGIVEGTDGWALALQAWALSRRHHGRAALALALTILSSWYLGIVGCALGAAAGLLDRRAWAGLLAGIALASPAILRFGSAFPSVAPLDASVRALLGARLTLPRPGVLPGDNPFAINTYVGFVVAGLALLGLRARPGLAILAGIFAVLSTGVGPWYELPVLRSLRFVYRWHAGTLLALAGLAGAGVEGLRASSSGASLARPSGSTGRLGWIAALITLEGLLLSPVETLLPAAPAEVPAIYDQVRGPILLEVPGPVALPPGVVNHSRPRARYFLYFQLHHGAATPWAPDFNGVGAGHRAAWLDAVESWDPLVRREPVPPDLDAARAAGVTQVMVHRDELRRNAPGFEAALTAGGAHLRVEDGELALYDL